MLGVQPLSRPIAQRNAILVEMAEFGLVADDEHAGAPEFAQVQKLEHTGEHRGL